MELPLLHPSSTSNTAFTLPRAQETEAKSLCKETGIRQHWRSLHCALLASSQHIHRSSHRPAAEMPCIPPGRDVCFPYLLQTAALQLWLPKRLLSLEITLKPLEGLTSPDRSEQAAGEGSEGLREMNGYIVSASLPAVLLSATSFIRY